MCKLCTKGAKKLVHLLFYSRSEFDSKDNVIEDNPTNGEKVYHKSMVPYRFTHRRYKFVALFFSTSLHVHLRCKGVEHTPFEQPIVITFLRFIAWPNVWIPLRTQPHPASPHHLTASLSFGVLHYPTIQTPPLSRHAIVLSGFPLQVSRFLYTVYLQR